MEVVGNLKVVYGSANLTNNKGAHIVSDVKYSVAMGSNSTKDIAIFNAGDITLNGNNSIGIYSAQGGNITNASTGNITVNSNESAAIYATNGSVIQNYGTINISSNANESYGIYVYNNIGSTEAYNNKGGVINVAGTKSYGMFVYITDSSDTQTQIKVSNNSIINVTGKDSYGMFVYYKNDKEERPDIVVINDGVIDVTGENSKDMDAIVPETENSTISSVLRTSSAPQKMTLINTGRISINKDINLSNNNEKVVVAKGGSYQANSFTGTAYADSTIVTDNFEKESVNEDSFIGQNNGINIQSDSYMYEASTILNSKGNTDVIMKQKSFDSLITDSNLSVYLNDNYDNQKGLEQFNLLKSATNKKQFNGYINQLFGYSMLSNITKQSLDIEKMISNTVNDNLLTKTSEITRYKFNLLGYQNKVDNKKHTSGYKDKVFSFYGFNDKKINTYTRLGAGLSIARSNTDFNDHSSRYNNLFEFYTSILLNHKNTKMLFKPKVGFAYGHYRRSTPYNIYKANTKEYYYGTDTVLHHNIKTKYITFVPQVMLNLTGLYIDSIHENNKGLKIKHQNSFSITSGVGMDIQKYFAINDNQSLKLAAGSWYFHEFGDRYKLKAFYNNMEGNYNIVSNRLQRNTGLLRFQTHYKYNNFILGGSIYKPLEQKRNIIYMLNIGCEL